MYSPPKKTDWHEYLTPHTLIPVTLLGGLLIFIIWAILPDGIYDYAPSFLRTENPSREPVWFPEKIYIKNYELTPIRKYKVDARLIGKHEYSVNEDQIYDLSPIDMFWGWGPMAHPNITQFFSVNIHHRAAQPSSWGVPTLRLSSDKMRAYTDNNHLIPANDEILQRMRTAPLGAMIRAEGFFVVARVNGEIWWASNLTYGWSGGIPAPYKTFKACKVIYVTKFDVLPESVPE